MEDALTNSVIESLTSSMFDNVLNSMFGDYSDTSTDNNEFSPWSPWGNTLFSPYNPYLTANTFPASYAYAQMLGEWMISQRRPVFNANQTYQGSYSF
jgi:hypothetical protein